MRKSKSLKEIVIQICRLRGNLIIFINLNFFKLFYFKYNIFRPRNHRHSQTWDRFEIVYYRNHRQNFAKCLQCSSIVSYKKTTGTASLIRHKCKNQSQQVKMDSTKADNIKMESLASLLVISNPPPLTPAPAFSPQPQSSSSPSVSVSSTSTSNKTSQAQPTSLIRSSYTRPDNQAYNNVERFLINAQIQWLSQSLISTEILGDSTYLSFLQNLINFGADYGKQKVTNFINRNAICHEMIPQKCKIVQSELMSALKDTEFSISYCTWSNVKDEKYVTVFVYYFNNNFEYKNAILGTRKCIESETFEIVKEITKMYQSSSENLKCVTDEDDVEEFDTYPCMISQISKMILTALNASDDNKNFFKIIFQKAHEVLKIHPKRNFEESSDDEKLKMFYELYEISKESEPPANSVIKKFINLLGILFSAISSLTEVNEDGTHCVTANRIYLWCKKFLKFYSEFSSEDKLMNNIAATLLKLIKENFTDSIYELYQIAVFLNPNFKSLKFLTLIERNVLLDIVKKNLQKLMSEDQEQAQPVAKKLKISKNQTHHNETFLEFMDITMESLDDQVNSEIQCYMGFKLENPVDILEFWRTTDCFPYLKKLARNYLNLPSCTFHGNCCFLSAGNEFYQKCRHLPADDIENLTFLHQNL